MNAIEVRKITDEIVMQNKVKRDAELDDFKKNNTQYQKLMEAILYKANQGSDCIFVDKDLFGDDRYDAWEVIKSDGFHINVQGEKWVISW